MIEDNIIDICASKGVAHALTDKGELYTWGINSWGNSENSTVYPHKISFYSNGTEFGLEMSKIKLIKNQYGNNIENIESLANLTNFA